MGRAVRRCPVEAVLTGPTPVRHPNSINTMGEQGYSIEGLRYFDVGIKYWTKTAEQILGKYGPSALLEYPAVTRFEQKPLLTAGAYTCYAGIARAPSGLYVFHLYEDNAYITLVHGIGSVPTGGMVGGIPFQQQRSHPNEFADKPFIHLEPSHAFLGGFNLMVLPGNEVLYAAGYFNASEIQ